ncbi:MAG TPA: purine-nucleoside phosphorylase [Pirellulales bacterium]|jgi:purine-nucleoside phosphorylase|nr:purine-nucleoside phosphorylase [Pirellulales bacterium]
MLQLAAQIAEAAAKIRAGWDVVPRAGLILGTGLGDLASHIEVHATWDYAEIPHFAVSTATSHRGRLIAGLLAGTPVLAMEGRVHAYEGYPLSQITLPVRVMKALGAQLLIATNAGGGMNPQFATGDVMLIEDHINLMGVNPLIGVNDDQLGPRFPDMSCPYDPQLINRGLELARQADIVAHRGVFVAVLGPNLETRAEYRFLRLIGADVVGMSTVPEVIVAVHAGLRVMAFSIVTDMCLPDALHAVDVAQIVAVAKQAEPKLRTLITGILADEKGSQRPAASQRADARQ